MRNAIWLFLFALVILAVFLPSYIEIEDLREKNAAYETQVKELNIKHEQLLEEKRMLEEDPEYLEKVAREKMGLVKEGEVIYRMTPRGDEEK